MKKILWFLSVVLILLLATGAYAGTRSDKCNTYSNDLGISAALDNYLGQLNRATTAGGDLLVYKNRAHTPKKRPHTKWKGTKFRKPMKCRNREPQKRKLKQKP